MPTLITDYMEPEVVIQLPTYFKIQSPTDKFLDSDVSTTILSARKM
jgi:hypothetical protein